MARRVFTCKDVEEARAFIGKKGIFTQDYKAAHDGDLTSLFATSIRSTLAYLSNFSFPFVPDEKDWSKGGEKISNYQFFSPDPVEEWVPFTAEDGPVLTGRVVKQLGENAWAMIVTSNDHGVFLGYRDTATSFHKLISGFTFLDGTPCGKKVVE